MLTRMQHPDHGFMYAVDKGDIDRLIKLGWSVEGPPKVEDPPTVKWESTTDPSAVPASWDEAVAPAVKPKRPGRPPKA